MIDYGGSCEITDENLKVVTIKKWPELTVLWLCIYQLIEGATK
jgi:hypothetical protein